MLLSYLCIVRCYLIGIVAKGHMSALSALQQYMECTVWFIINVTFMPVRPPDLTSCIFCMPLALVPMHGRCPLND